MENKMSIKLKIKSKHLSEEARIIRFEEHKLLKNVKHTRQKYIDAGHNEEFKYWLDKNHQTYSSISHHRKWDVRNEARATYIARAYLSGVPYEKVEMKRKDERLFRYHIFPRLCAMIVKYGPKDECVWDRTKNRYVPTKDLKDKIAKWCNM
jgi:hypothetical protein